MSGQQAPSRRSRFTSRSTATVAASRCATSPRSCSTASRIAPGGGLGVRTRRTGARDGLLGASLGGGDNAMSTGGGTYDGVIPVAAGAGDGGETTDARRADWDRMVTATRCRLPRDFASCPRRVMAPPRSAAGCQLGPVRRDKRCCRRPREPEESTSDLGFRGCPSRLCGSYSGGPDGGRLRSA